ncbi:MAG TPA: amino acid adenylation domain-containing protein [Herpetosiphonaceae bacterium]
MQQPEATYQPIHRLFEAQAAARPDALALSYQDAHWSYEQINRRANQLAHYLQKQGVGPDVLVGICAERSPDLVIGLLGILKAGGAYLPLDPLFPQDRLQFMLDDTGVSLLLTQERLRPLLPAHAARTIALDADWEQLALEPDTNPTSAVTIEHLAYVTYTSGSTGRPKGSAIPHRSIPGFMFNVDYVDLNATQTWLHYSSISWDALTLELWPALLYGARCVLYPAQMASPHELAEAIRAHGVDILWLTAALFNAMIDMVPEALAGVKQLMVGGEQLSVQHVRRALKLLPSTRLINGYGPSECTVFSCCYPIPQGLPDNLSAIPIGRPIGDRRVYLLDARLQRVPIGVPGELYVGGPAVARGYLNRPELTAEKIVPDPFNKQPGATMYKTGDLVRYRRDGLIEFVGRIDHQVKVRGFRIELEEIETVLRQHPQVSEGVVLAREDVPGEKRLVAYVVEQRTGAMQAPGMGTRHGHPAHQEQESSGAMFSVLGSPQELRKFLGEHLPDYMIPSAFVVLPSLPLNANGKIDRGALPAPEQIRPDLDQPFVAPRTPIEEVVAGIWADVLDLDRVGVYDNFFELGGQSLVAARIMARVREACHVELSIRSLLEQPTVAGLAEQIASSQPIHQAAPITPAPREAALPLSYAQQRLWFLDRLEPNSPLYNVPAAVRLIGSLDKAALQHSLDRIVQRHEILRTTFVEGSSADGQTRQMIAATGTIPLAEIDLRTMPAAEREAEVARLAIAEARQPFDLQRGPLVRTVLLALDDAEHVLLLTMHHIISDGWSMDVLIREVAAFYAAFVSEQPDAAAVPDLAIQYADYAIWQRDWLAGSAGDSVLEDLLSYWRQQLAGAPPLLKLPTDRPRPAVQSYRGARHAFTLPTSLAGDLTALSRREGVTLFMTLLAAFDVLLQWYSGQDDIVVGSPIAGRSRVELEPLVGFFVNTLVLRVNLAGQETFPAVLHHVRDVTLGGYAHQDLPFDKLVEALQPERNLSYMPLFQVWFVLQNAPRAALRLPGLTLHPLEVDYGMARYDLRLGLSESAEGLSGSFEYNSDLFDASTIARLAQLYESLLTAVVQQPQASLDDLRSLLAEASREHQAREQQTLKATSLQKLKRATRESIRGTETKG